MSIGVVLFTPKSSPMKHFWTIIKNITDQPKAVGKHLFCQRYPDVEKDLGPDALSIGKK